MLKRPELVMVVNSAPGILVMLREVIESAGFLVITIPMEGLTDDDVKHVIEMHRPQVVLFDIPWPFEQNMRRFMGLARDTEMDDGVWLPMCTSQRYSELLTSEGWQTITKPFDIDEVMELVTTAVERATGTNLRTE